MTEQDRNILAVALLRFEQGPGHANDIRRAKELRALLAASREGGGREPSPAGGMGNGSAAGYTTAEFSNLSTQAHGYGVTGTLKEDGNADQD